MEPLTRFLVTLVLAVLEDSRVQAALRSILIPPDTAEIGKPNETLQDDWIGSGPAH